MLWVHMCVGMVLFLAYSPRVPKIQGQKPIRACFCSGSSQNKHLTEICRCPIRLRLTILMLLLKSYPMDQKKSHGHAFFRGAEIYTPYVEVGWNKFLLKNIPIYFKNLWGKNKLMKLLINPRQIFSSVILWTKPEPETKFFWKVLFSDLSPSLITMKNLTWTGLY